ncbi:AAA family ATPase [Aerosakkonema funiforme]|uniref:AAA family ATPase n=1 Tax=Aerosakkonema funiforme FACHB-1375 TaxID=2949571 RepID=A0A926ZI97_9CYAN|nr:AAA family ATPase [Aerosakkonema funiforme]MBD2183860.1 AAA family ATPase [Aerosakkonema funiforme FACHB-1375]
MSSLFWAIKWDWGIYTLNRNAEKAIIGELEKHLIGKAIGNSDIGKCLEQIPVIIDGARTSFSAHLERVDSPITFTVDRNTVLRIRLVTDFDSSSSLPKRDTNMEPSLATDLDELVTFQTTFSPQDYDSHYRKIYESLIGIAKEEILAEMISLLTPFEKKEKWSKQYYGSVISALQTTATKAPVIVFGGDPGTGKTALATSIGAALAPKLGERVHFRHMSLLLRGMGYQGRAASMIVKSFENIKQEYLKLKEPMILFFDEAEAIVGSRSQADSSSGSQENIAIVDAVIIGVDSLRKGIQARIVAIFATNLTARLDVALMRRSYYYQFNRPDEQTRRILLESSLRGMGFNKDDINKLVEATKPRQINNRDLGFTPSDIVESIIGRALNEAIQSNTKVSIESLLRYCEKTNPTGTFST